jgi:hypothetical protein
MAPPPPGYEEVIMNRIRSICRSLAGLPRRDGALAASVGVSAATHTRYLPLTRAAPAGDGAAARPAHEHRAAAHAGEPALAVAR